jgi:hypothetical protein
VRAYVASILPSLVLAGARGEGFSPSPLLMLCTVIFGFWLYLVVSRQIPAPSDPKRSE